MKLRTIVPAVALPATAACSDSGSTAVEAAPLDAPAMDAMPGLGSGH
jgi:hypothetical protein